MGGFLLGSGEFTLTIFRGEIAAREHQALLESALLRDWEKAQTIMVSHIQGCVEHALKEDKAGLVGGPNAPARKPVAKSERTNGKQPSAKTASPAKRRAKL